MKVLHIFSPNFKIRFSGDVALWNKKFKNWVDGDVNHYVYDFDYMKMDKAGKVFDFKYPDYQKNGSCILNIVNFFRLFIFLIFRKNDFTILHVHVLGWGGLLLGMISRVLGILSIYESVLFDSDNPSNIEKQKFGKIKLALLKRYLSIVAISLPLVDDFSKHNFNVFELKNPVDGKVFHPIILDDERKILRSQLGLPDQSFIWLNVGSVRFRKGTDILIKNFIEYCNKNKSEVYLILVGPQSKAENPSISEEFSDKLKIDLEKGGCTGRVKFVGLIEDPLLLARYYQLADVFVFPSRQEGLPNVVLEAMASSLPVVVSDLPVLKNLIEDNENGLIIQLEKEFSLLDAVGFIENCKLEARKLGEEARKYVLLNNNFELWQKKLTNIYFELALGKSDLAR